MLAVTPSRTSKLSKSQDQKQKECLGQEVRHSILFVDVEPNCKAKDELVKNRRQFESLHLVTFFSKR